MTTPFTDLTAAIDECDWLAIMNAQPHVVVDTGKVLKVWPAEEVLPGQQILYRYPERREH